MNNELRICGRLTKNKKPCQNSPVFYTACRIHATEQDKAIDKWGWDKWSDGYKIGEARGRESAIAEIERTKRQEAALTEKQYNFKLRTESNCQIIQCGNYAYVVPHCIPDLKVGDIVCLPPSWFIKHCTESKVTDLGTSFAGNLQRICGVVKRI